MNPSTLGILPRLGLALLPWLTGELVDNGFYGCFASESPFCIYYWHPPGMDVMFALLVLAPFISARTFVTLRVLALIILSVLVHALSVDLLVATRGSLAVFGVDSIFVNIIPIAVAASVVTVSLAALVCGLNLTMRLLVYSLLAGIPVASVFLLVDLAPDMPWRVVGGHWYWGVWHLSICSAIYCGRLVTPRTKPRRLDQRSSPLQGKTG